MQPHTALLFPSPTRVTPDPDVCPFPCPRMPIISWYLPPTLLSFGEKVKNSPGWSSVRFPIKSTPMCTHTPVKSNERSLALHSAKQGTLTRPLIERTWAGKANSTTTEASPRERGGKWTGASLFPSSSTAPPASLPVSPSALLSVSRGFQDLPCLEALDLLLPLRALSGESHACTHPPPGASSSMVPSQRGRPWWHCPFNSLSPEPVWSLQRTPGDSVLIYLPDHCIPSTQQRGQHRVDEWKDQQGLPWWSSG